MDNLLEEAKEDVALERIVNFWQSYRYYVIGGIAGIFLSAGGFVYFQDQALKKKIEIANLYHQVVTEIEKEGKSASSLQNLLRHKESGYVILAYFRAAAEEFQKERTVSKHYADLRNDKKVDGKFKDLSILIEGLQRLEKGEHEEAKKIILPLAEKNGPYTAHAKELMANAIYASGDQKAALRIYQELAANESIAEGIRMRAIAMSQQLTSQP